MKDFIDVTFDLAQCKREIDELRDFLASRGDLAERAEIQPFFKTRQQLSAFLGTWVPDIGPGTKLAYEFPLFGDFVADILVGNSEQETYCLIEFENAKPDSIFVKGTRATNEWGRRFEHGFSQMVDWFYALDDMRSTARFREIFGKGHVKFDGLLVIGRNAGLSDSDRRRLRWRADKLSIDSHFIHCVTFDDVVERLAWRINTYGAAKPFEQQRNQQSPAVRGEQTDQAPESGTPPIQECEG